MPALKEYQLFISHAWKYGDQYTKLVDLLKGANNFTYKNYSAPEDKPLKNLDSTDVKTKADIKDAIDRKIKLCQVVLVISGMYANNREWMEYEINSAKKYSKPIIAIKPWGNSKMPQFIQDVADKVVNWQTTSIVDAIREAI